MSIPHFPACVPAMRSKAQPPRFTSAILLVWALFVLVSQPAIAQSNIDRPLQASVEQNFNHDSNIFRLANQGSGATPPAANYYITRAQLGWRMHGGKQKYEIDLGINNRQFSELSYLSFLGHELKGKWHWAYSDDWSGTIQAETSQSQPSRTEVGGLDAGSLSVKSFKLSLRKSLAPDLQFFSSLDTFSRDLVRTSGQNTNYDAVEFDAGLRLKPNPAREANLSVRHINGEYRQTLNPTLPERDKFSDLMLVASGFSEVARKSLVSGNIGLRKRSYDLNAQRDFQGPFFDVRFVWPLSDAIRLTTSYELATEAASIQDFNSARRNTLRVNPTVQLNAKTVLDLRVEHLNRRFLTNGPGAGTLNSGSLTGAARVDNINSAFVTVEHSLTHSITLGMSLGNESRSSTDRLRSFNNTSTSVYLAWRY